MPEVTQVEMTEYLRTNLPFIMMTMEDLQGRNLWDKHGRMDLRTGVFWNIGKLPEDVLKQVWDYTYTLFMQEKESPGSLKYQADLGRIRYELEKVGWGWGGSQCSQGVCHETFRKGADLLKLQYGHQDDVMGEAGARPLAGDMNYMSHYPLNEIVPALMKAQWVYQGHVYSQGVYYANLALTPFMIHLEFGGESQVLKRMEKEYVKEHVKRLEKGNPGNPQQHSYLEKGNIVRIRADGRIPTSKIRAEVIDVGMGSVTVRITEPDPLKILKLGQEITVGTDTVRKIGNGNPGPQRKWAASQVWAACKQAGVPVDERDVIVKHYQETGELPFQTWPSLRLIESWPEQPQFSLSPGTKNEIAHEQLEEAGGTFDLYVYADRTWKLHTPEGWAEGKYDAEGDSYEAKHQHPFIRDWINEQGEILFGKVQSWQIDTALERKAQQNWDVLPTTSRLQYLTTYVKPSVPSAENFSQSSWVSLPNNIKDIIRHAYAGEQAGTRYVVEADITHTSRHTFYVLAGNEAEAKQKVKGGDTTYVEDHDQYIISPLPDSAYNFKVVRPARPDESQYYP